MLAFLSSSVRNKSLCRWDAHSGEDRDRPATTTACWLPHFSYNERLSSGYVCVAKKVNVETPPSIYMYKRIWSALFILSQDNSTSVCCLVMCSRWAEELLVWRWDRKVSRGNSCWTVVVGGIENPKPEHLLFFTEASPLAGLGIIKKQETAKYLCQESQPQLCQRLYMVNSQDNLTNV